MEYLFLIIFIISLPVSLILGFVYLVERAKKEPTARAWKKRTAISFSTMLASLILAIVTLLINGDPNTTNNVATPNETEEVAAEEPEENEEVNTSTQKPVTNTSSNTIKETKKEIDTSVFEYAKSTKVTDAIEINKHVTVFVDMSSDLSPGLATQHVLNQTYDFLLQDDISDAETVSINITQGEGNKIAMYTIRKSEFIADDQVPMIEAVLAATDLEFVTQEVDDFGKAMEYW